jgi:CMP/dCMP kinase
LLLKKIPVYQFNKAGKYMKNYNIAIDGPAGAGKSTIARKVAQLLQFIYVDTGAMYRAMGLYMLKENVKLDNSEAVADACKNVEVTIAYIEGEQQVILNKENVTGLIRTEEAGKMASLVAKENVVRKKMVELQKNLADTSNVIMDGRDIGTVVLPDADLKVYLTASADTRALRRFKELNENGLACNLEEIKDDIIARDYQDMNREVSPLKQAEDAEMIDSSDMTIDEVVETIISLFKEKSNGENNG